MSTQTTSTTTVETQPDADSVSVMGGGVSVSDGGVTAVKVEVGSAGAAVSQEPPRPQYATREEAKQAFKELLKEKVSYI